MTTSMAATNIPLAELSHACDSKGKHMSHIITGNETCEMFIKITLE